MKTYKSVADKQEKPICVLSDQNQKKYLRTFTNQSPTSREKSQYASTQTKTKTKKIIYAHFFLTPRINTHMLTSKVQGKVNLFDPYYGP